MYCLLGGVENNPYPLFSENQNNPLKSLNQDPNSMFCLNNDGLGAIKEASLHSFLLLAVANGRERFGATPQVLKHIYSFTLGKFHVCTILMLEMAAFND